jgi:hypothetical protein
MLRGKVLPAYWVRVSRSAQPPPFTPAPTRTKEKNKSEKKLKKGKATRNGMYKMNVAAQQYELNSA